MGGEGAANYHEFTVAAVPHAAQKFSIDMTIRFCSNFTTMWFKDFSNNLCGYLRRNGNKKFPIGESVFVVNFALKLIPATLQKIS